MLRYTAFVNNLQESAGLSPIEAHTYLVLNRFRRMRGELTAEEEAAEMAFVKARLAEIGAIHWQEFLAAW